MAACEKRYRSIFSPATTAQRVFPANSKEASVAACEKRYRSIFSPATTAQRVFPANSKEASVARGRKGSVQVFSAAHTDLACQRQGRNLSLWRPVKFRPPLLCTRFKPFALLTYTGHHLHVIYDSINVTNELNLPHLCYLKL